ncbi:LacI family DNA-binding transcriptional regulator [Gulosibacter molinativorax]|uniref:LacI family transcriptional regulator n=1 Tax=Gulosibacter molinativorax TaxID=256821 RepID=A0ABT7CC94_9MICO|nr:LacI family DNA-binding transcriptional regulator [Gulosibacter molinativorax]MDJ1372241.1 LacI family transcriptional regulator [Gulosibacter molinativorax]QUY63476.1 LacI family transcriptional regulator [Gulosibacter molinativorax]
MSPLGRTTLKELATMASVTPSTVSRVLNDPAGTETKWASPETAQRMIDLARETGYVKNPHAASLRTKRSGLIGVLFPRLNDYVYSAMYEGVDKYATAHSYFAMVTTSHDDAELRDQRIHQLLDRRVDGILLSDALLDDPVIVELQEREFPLVVVNRRSGSALSCASDDRRGGYLMGEHFLRQGYESIGIITAGESISTSLDRQDGFLAALQDGGFDMSAVTIVHKGFSVEDGEDGVQELLAKDPAPRAVFAVNDQSAIGAIGAIRGRGLRVPEDLAVAGYNDTPLARALGLTTVSTPLHEVGSQAVQMLECLFRKEEVSSVILPVELIVRATA